MINLLSYSILFLQGTAVIIALWMMIIVDIQSSRNSIKNKHQKNQSSKRLPFFKGPIYIVILGSLFFLITLLGQFKECAIIDLLNREGVLTTAKVVSLHPGGPNNPFRWVDYKFKIQKSGEDSTVQVSSEVSNSFFEKLTASTTITIVYSPTQPDIARPQENSPILRASSNSGLLAILSFILLTGYLVNCFYTYRNRPSAIREKGPNEGLLSDSNVKTDQLTALDSSYPTYTDHQIPVKNKSRAHKKRFDLIQHKK